MGHVCGVHYRLYVLVRVLGEPFLTERLIELPTGLVVARDVLRVHSETKHFDGDVAFAIHRVVESALRHTRRDHLFV